MEFQNVIAERRSIRKYKSTPVEQEKLLAVLDAARLAPSWKNLQCWRFIVVETAQGKEAVMEAFGEDNPGLRALTSAPILIIVCGDPYASGNQDDKEYYLVDVGIAFEHIILAAQNLGLGTCFLGVFKEAILKKNLNVPDGWRIVGVTPLGYPDQAPKSRPRKELKEIVFRELFGYPWD